MSACPLLFGRLEVQGRTIYRSALRWLGPADAVRRPGEAFAYCTLSLVADRRAPAMRDLFGEETLQVAFASPIAARVRASKPERGGALRTRSVEVWDPDEVIAWLDGEGQARPARLLVLAGGRLSTLADSDVGLLPGWLARRRGWWCGAGERPATVLSLGLCDSNGVVAGETGAFLEMFEANPEGAHCVCVNERPLVFATPVLLDSLDRTPAQFEAIAADLHRAVASQSVVPTAADWVLFGALLASLKRSPLQERYTLFSSAGSHREAGADLVLLSLSAEPRALLRHRALGYHIHVLTHIQDEGGPAFRAWLSGSFEPVRRSLDDLRRDYQRLMGRLGRSRLAIVNRMSSSGFEDLSSYAAFDLPLGDTLSTVAAKEQNLMLHDLAATHDVSIIDLDALAAEMGGAEHVPDGVHQSGAIQEALRREIIAALQGSSDLEGHGDPLQTAGVLR